MNSMHPLRWPQVGSAVESRKRPGTANGKPCLHRRRESARPAMLRCLLAAGLLLPACSGTTGAVLAAPAVTQEQIERGTKLCSQADSLLAQGKKAEARKKYEEVLTFLPESPRAQKGVEACAGASPSSAKASPPVARKGSRKVVSLRGKTLRISNVASTMGPCILVFNADGMVFTCRAGDKLKDDKGAIWVSREVRIGGVATYPFLREGFQVPYAARDLKAPKPETVEAARRKLAKMGGSGQPAPNP